MTKRKVLAVVSACALLLTMFVSLIPVYAGKLDDTTGWTLGEGSTIAGNPDYGWTLNQAGCNQDRQPKYQNQYVTDIPMRDLQIQFVANYAANGLWTINFSDKRLNPLPMYDDLGDTGLCLILEKREGDVLGVQRWSNGAPGAVNGKYLFDKNINFKVDVPNTLHFVEQDGRWYVALNDTVFVDPAMDVTDILAAMDGKQVIVGSLSDPTVDFPYINFADAKKVNDWKYTSQVAVAGSEERGFTMVGKEGYDGYAVYGQPVSLLNNEFQVRLDFDSDWTYFGFDTVPEVTGENYKLNADIDMQFYIKDGRLDIGLFSGGQFVTDELYSIENFDFDAVHVFGFVEDNEQYYLTVDGKRAPYNEILSNHVAKMKDAGVYWRLGAGNGSTVQYFTDIKVLGWNVGEGSTLTGGNAAGWQLQQSADTGKPSSYQTGYSLKDLQIKFTASYDDNVWINLNIGTTQIGALPNKNTLDAAKGMSFILEKKGDDGSYLRFQRWCSESGTGSNYLATVDIKPLDFSQEHIFHFVEKDGRYYPAIDDTLLDTDVTELIEAYDQDSALQPMVTLLSNGAVSFSSLQFAEVPHTVIGGWNLNNATVTGDASNGYTVTGPAGASASYQMPIDLSTQSVKLRLNHTGEWQGLTFNAESDAPTGVALPTADKLSLILGREGDELRASVYLASGEGCVVRIPNFTWDAEHTIGFTKVGDNWYLNIDGEVYTSPQDESRGITAAVNTALNNMSTKDTYVTVMSEGNTPLNITGFRFVNTTVSQVGDWRLNGTVTIEDNGENGFNLAGGGNSQTKYQKPIDLSTQSVKLQLNHTGEWQGINFTTSREPNGVTKPSADALTLILGREGNELRASIWIGDVAGGESQGEGCVVRIPEFAWNEEHTFGFSKVEDSWYLNIDGRVYTEPLEGSKGITGYVTAALENMVTVPTYAGVINAEKVDLAITGYRYVSTETPEVQTDWRLSGTVTAEGDRENGYALSGEGYAAYKTPFDMADWSVKMQFVPTFDDSNPEQIVNGWQAIVFSDVCTVDTTVLPGVPTQGGEHNVLTFILGREANGTTMRLSLFMQVGENKEERAITYIDDFDWDAEHTFGFAKVGDNWYVVFDGKTYTSPSGDTEDRIITSAITDVLNAMNGKDAYIRVEASDALNMPKFNLVETGRNEQEEGEWELSTDMTAEETANGWTVSGIPGIAGWKEVFAVDQDVFRIQFKPEVGNWAYFSVGDTYSVSAEQFMGPDNDNNMICFILGREDENTLRLSMWNGTAESAMVYIHSFDFDKAHDFQFVQRRGNWYLSIDGRTILSPQDDGDDKIITNWITEAVNNLKGNEAYIRVSACAGVPITLTNIQMIGEGHDNSSGSQTGVVFPIAAVAALGVSFLAVLVLRKKKA